MLEVIKLFQSCANLSLTCRLR